MRFFIFIIIFTGLSAVGFSQTKEDENSAEKFMLPPSNTERYGIDFKISEWSVIDQVILDQIKIADYEELRHETNDLTFYLSDLNLTIELFSIEKTLENAQKSKINIPYFHWKYVK